MVIPKMAAVNKKAEIIIIEFPEERITRKRVEQERKGGFRETRAPHLVVLCTRSLLSPPGAWDCHFGSLNFGQKAAKADCAARIVP